MLSKFANHRITVAELSNYETGWIKQEKCVCGEGTNLKRAKLKGLCSQLFHTKLRHLNQ